MIKKLKSSITRNTLERDERKIFDSLCRLYPENKVEYNKEKAISLANLDCIKDRKIGVIYKNKALRDIYLDNEEIRLFNEGEVIIEEFYNCQKIIKNKGYKILCSPELIERFLYESNDVKSLKSTVKMIDEELRGLKRDIEIKSSNKSSFGYLSKEEYDKANFSNMSNLQNNQSRKEVNVVDLNDTQKESLAKLGLSFEEDEKINLLTLKKMYTQKLYCLNLSAVGNSKNDAVELAEAFSNVKKAFTVC